MNPTCPATSKAKEDSHPTTTSSPSQRVVLFSVLLPASRQFVLSRADISYSLQAAVSSIRNRESEPESMHITRVFLSYSEKKEENERKRKNKRKRKRQRRIRRKFMSVSILRRNEEFGYRSPTSARLFPFFLFYFFFFLFFLLTSGPATTRSVRRFLYCGPSTPPYLDISREYCFWECESLVGMHSLEVDEVLR